MTTLMGYWSGLKHSHTGIKQNYEGGDRKRIVKVETREKLP